MATISSYGPMSPWVQFKQYFTSLSSLPSSLCERTNTAYRRTYVMKRDNNRNIIFHDHRVVTEDEKGEKKITWTKIAVRSYIENVKTGNLCWDEEWYVVSVKCAVIALGMPFYTLGKVCYYACKTPLEVTILAVQTLDHARQQLAQGKYCESGLGILRNAAKMPGMVGRGLFEIVKAPLFLFGEELILWYGFFKPFHVRESEAMLEEAWQNGASYMDDFRNIPARDGESCWQAFVTDIQTSHPFYLAHCFQSRGNTNDPNISVIRREAL